MREYFFLQRDSIISSQLFITLIFMLFKIALTLIIKLLKNKEEYSVFMMINGKKNEGRKFLIFFKKNNKNI
jgi:hypothetical protein